VKDASNAAPDDATPSPSQANAANSTGSTDEEVVESGELGPSIAQVRTPAPDKGDDFVYFESKVLGELYEPSGMVSEETLQELRQTFGSEVLVIPEDSRQRPVVSGLSFIGRIVFRVGSYAFNNFIRPQINSQLAQLGLNG